MSAKTEDKISKQNIKTEASKSSSKAADTEAAKSANEYDPEKDWTAMAAKKADAKTAGTSVSTGGMGNYLETKDYYSLNDVRPYYSQLNAIGGMPPSFDNYIDPPASFFDTDSGINDMRSMDCVGMDYSDACLVRGQYINYIPIDISFSTLSEVAAKAIEGIATALPGDWGGDTDELMKTQLRWAEYWTTVNYHFRAVIMMLDLVDVFGNNSKGGNIDVPGFKNSHKLLSIAANLEFSVNDNNFVSAYSELADPKNGGASNSQAILRAVAGLTNVDRPMIPFYVDGFIEMQDASSMDIGESELFSAWKSMGTGASNIMKEIMQNSAPGSIKDSTLLWNPVIPRLFKDFKVERSYSYKHKFVSIGSDPLGILLFVIRNLCMYLPFIRPRAAGNSLNTYKAPFYLQAFSKGMVNVKFGAIQSVEIVRDPMFVTAQGIPTQLEMNVTLTSLSTMEVLPDFGTTWAQIFGSNSKHYEFVGKEGAAINYLATLCGINVYNMSFMTRFRARLKAKVASLRSLMDVKANVSRVYIDKVDKFIR